MGQELYKLSLSRLLAQATSIALVDGGRWLGSKTRKINKWVSTLWSLCTILLLQDLSVCWFLACSDRVRATEC